MAQCKQSAADFVLWAFRPRVAVISTPEVEAACQKNNLSLTEMLQPFSKLQTDAQLRDPLGVQVSVRGLCLSLEPWDATPPPPPLARRLLSESVAQNVPQQQQNTAEVPPRTPWFEAWRERLLQVEPPGEHEFSRRLVACVLAVSSGADAPLQQLRQLAQQQHQLQHGQPAGAQRWFSNNVFIYYLLVTDVGSVQEGSAEAVFEEVQAAFGAHCCHHLRLNSRPPEHREPHLPDPWAGHLSRRTTNAESVPSRCSGGDTPAEVAQLTALPSLVLEPAPNHPLSPESRASSPNPPPPAEPLSDGQEPAVPAPTEEQTTPGLVVNRVSYPPAAPAGIVAAETAQGHGACLSASDLDRLAIFVSELCVRGLLPHVERQLRGLSDVVNNRKGMSRSLLSATKRWFGGNKPGAAAAVTSVIYSQEAPEIQVRRLGDLAFMFGHYDLAYQAYHTAKRDFSGDSAWLHFAGALEMAALSVFLHAGAAKPFPQHYLDQAIATYLDSCRVPEYALRATLFSTECLKARGQWAEAALQFIRLTAEEADLRSALLLEQAAHCFLNSQPPALRKYAFHMILSGHRFSKAGQRRHSLRAYKQAAQVYEGHGWRLADDHIAFTLGRHAEALQEHDSALLSLERVLSGATAEALQAAAQQAALLREYLHLHKQSSPSSLPTLPLPTLMSQQTRVLVSQEQEPAADGWTAASGANFTDDEDDNVRWSRLEEQCVEFLGLAGAVFRPTLQCLTAKTDNTTAPRLPAGEPVRVQLVLRNPLRVALELTDLRLQFSFESASIDDSASVQQSDSVSTQTISHCFLEEASTQEVTLSLTPSRPGRLTVLGYEYSLGMAAAEATVQCQPPPLTVRGCQPINVRGRRLHASKEERARVMYAEDKRLQVAVEEPGARLQVAFRGLPSSMLCGQIQPVLVRVTNTGSRPVSRLLLATPDPQLLVLEPESTPDEHDHQWRQVRPTAARQGWAGAPPPGPVSEVTLPAGGLPPAGTLTRRLWLRAPQTEGGRALELLLCWRDGGARPRLLRHSGRLLVAPSLALAVRTTRTVGPSAGLQLELEVTGLQAGELPLQLETVALASTRWKLQSSAPPLPDTGVLRGQSTYLGVPAERVPEQTAPEMQLTAAHLGKHQGAVCGRPASDFLLRHRSSTVGTGGATAPGAAETGGAAEATALAAAVTVDATLLLLWRIKGVDGTGLETTIHGQHHLTVEKLGVSAATCSAVIGGSTEQEPRPPVTIVPAVATEPPPPHWPGKDVMDRLVSLSPLHRPEVFHDFSRNRLCVIPVTMLVRNHSRCALVVHLSAVSAGGSSARAVLPYSCHVSDELLWVGRTHPYVTVPAGESARLRLAAAVTRPGLYDLGSVGVACRRVGGADSELTEQGARVESAVVVRDVTDVGRT